MIQADVGLDTGDRTRAQATGFACIVTEELKNVAKLQNSRNDMEMDSSFMDTGF